jgi:hypothetical protein
MFARPALSGLVMLGLSLLASRPASGQAQQGRQAHPLTTQIDEATRRELIAAREGIWRAWFGNDTVQLKRLLPRAAASAEPEGFQNREEIFDGARQFAASGGKLVSLSFSDTQMLVDGVVAVVHSTYRVETETSGKRSSTTGRATEVFVREGGRWVNPFWHLQP